MKTNSFLSFSSNLLFVLQILTFAGLVFGSVVLFQVEGISMTGVLEATEETSELLETQPSVQLKIKDPSRSGTRLIMDDVSIFIPLLNFGERTVLLVYFLMLFGLIIYGLNQLRILIKTAMQESPFTRENVVRFYRLALVLLGFPLFDFIGKQSVRFFLLENYDFVGLEIKTGFDFWSWAIAAILFFTVGKIIDQGIKMQDEQALTI